MADDSAAQIAALRALREATADPQQRAALDAAIAALERPASPAINFGTDNHINSVSIQGDVAGGNLMRGGVALSNDARINGVVVGVNLGTIIYGRDPSEDERRRLVWYLHPLANELRRLPLRGLDPTLADGRGVDLSRVYMMLATESEHGLCSGLFEHLGNWFENNDPTGMVKVEYRPENALPTDAVINTSWWPTSAEPASPEQWHTLFRALLAIESVAQQARLVLLGDPGGGKTTFLRHLAWALACRGIDQTGSETRLLDWADDRRLLPVILPLRRLAGALAVADAGAQTVYETLCAIVAGYGVKDPHDLLTDALVRGAAIVLLDSLDEVPIEATTTSAGRMATVRAVRAFADRYQRTPLVLTCRSRAFSDDLRSCLGWPVETLAPFTLGQIRHFVPAWYAELVEVGQLTKQQAARLSDELITTIAANSRLRDIATTPLLLTLMAIVLFNRGELPRDRPQLYERILNLLLGQWDQVRDGRGLSDAVGLPNWSSDRFQSLLDQLSYTAHRAATSADGRGRLERGTLYAALIDFFRKAQVPAPGDAALRWLEYVEQRSGLIAPDGPESYVFAHLTLQEHCAGRHIALNSENPVALVMEHRVEDRWREPIFLGAGLMHPAVLNTLLTNLIDFEGKEPERWYRDMILAAEIGKDRDWKYLRTRPMVNVERLLRDLKQGLVTLLGDASQPLPVAERVRAGFLLGDLGDPRFPVELAQWRDELAQCSEQFGWPAGYLCYVPGGTYRIGGWAEGEAAAEIALQPFWVARFPITVGQYALFVAEGYGPGAERWWTKEGWAWCEENKRWSPRYWGRPGYDGTNQPVVTLTWYEATAYCAWLTERLSGALPPGYVVRLPTEAEWEAAAAYDGAGQRRTYPWGEAEPTPELAIYDAAQIGRPAPVGCCPAGGAACGALDLAGNVWELAASEYRDYPAGSHAPMKDLTGGQTAWRGGSWARSSSSVRCGARAGLDIFRGDLVGYGFRCVVAPRL